MLDTPLRTKIAVPPGRKQAVFRSHLHKRLDAAHENRIPIMLVSAKAGAGKSSLVSQWLRAADLQPAWLSLDVEDNDLGRFVNYVVAALQQASMVELPDSISKFDAVAPLDPETMASLILEWCFETNVEPMLVLDDYHLVESERVHAFIQGFAEGLGHTGHLVLISRTDPPLPLARWRGRGLMAEIRDADLRFQAEEVEKFLREIMKLDLSSSQLSILAERTEGWIVGLQLAGITMRHQTQDGGREEFIRNFGGTNRYILDYLMEEVLGQQPTHIREFLLETSILDRFSVGVCDAVSAKGELGISNQEPGTAPTASGEGESERILRQLEESNMFVIPFDAERQWFRYHHLFSDLLRNELHQRKSPADIRKLHKRASRWFRENHLNEEAISHAIAARDYEAAATIIEENIVNLLSQSTVPRLLRWIKAIPEGIVRSRPWIGIYRANTLAFAGQIEGVEDILDSVDGLAEDDPESRGLKGFSAAIRSYVANLQGDPERTFELAAQSEEYLTENYINARAMAAYAVADAHFALDNMAEADESFQEMLRLGEKSEQLMLIVTALCELASVRKVQGRLHAAQELYSQAWDQLVSLNGLGTRLRCHYEFGLADLLYEWNRLDEAYQHVMKGMDIRSRLGGYYVTGDIPLIRILQAQAESKEALEALRAVEQVVASSRIQLSGARALRAAGVHLYVTIGDLERARSYLENGWGDADLEVMARAGYFNARGRFEETLALLNQPLSLATKGNRVERVIGMLCHRALALEGLGQHAEADASIMEAVSMARPEGFIRLFVDIDPKLAILIQRCFDPHQAVGPDAKPIDRLLGEYAATLLAAFTKERQIENRAVDEMLNQSQSESYSEPLTQREIEVLTLLSQGLSNKELASQLVIAPSTVKQHLKNIYGKLNVHSRTEAVARARELNLLL